MAISNLAQTTRQLPLWGWAALGVASLALWWKLATQQRKPSLPLLRISSRPGRLGELDDIRLYLNDYWHFMEIGYERYSKHGKNYLINTPVGTLTICAPKFLEEIRRAPESHVNNLLANMDLMQFKWTLGPRVAFNQYHMDIPIRKSLTQNLGPRLPDIVDEGKLSLDHILPATKEWSLHDPTQLSLYVITRTANRVLFGVDLARNEEFLDLSIKHTVTMFGGANTIRHFPAILKPVVLWWKTNVYAEQAQARRLLGPIIQKRLDEQASYERDGLTDKWAAVKPNDAMQWILDVTAPEERRVDRLVLRMLNMSIAAIHTSAFTFSDTFLLLALSPGLHDELREEIVTVFRNEGGWTKQTLTYLVKLDSLLTEASRVTGGMAAVRLIRRTLRDWEMSDGTVLPKGTDFAIPSVMLHRDDKVYSKPLEFDPYRMYRKRQEQGKANQYQFVMTGEHNLHFGHGVHACPGRFFAANEIKTLLVSMIMRYDFYAEVKGGMEAAIRGTWYGPDRAPPADAKVFFRDRCHLVPEDLRDYF